MNWHIGYILNRAHGLQTPPMHLRDIKYFYINSAMQSSAIAPITELYLLYMQWSTRNDRRLGLDHCMYNI